jgi:hypothetical protein
MVARRFVIADQRHDGAELRERGIESAMRALWES